MAKNYLKYAGLGITFGLPREGAGDACCFNKRASHKANNSKSCTHIGAVYSGQLKCPNKEVEIVEEGAWADMSVTEEALISARSRTNPNEQWVLIIAIKTINYRTDRNNQCVFQPVGQ